MTARLLALETSQAACSVACWINGEMVIRHQVAPRRQTELLLPMIDEVLGEAGLKLEDLDAIAYGRGPGSFTGLRIVTAVAQGLGLAADKPLLGVSSMACVAQALWSQRQVERTLVCLDARMDEVYWGEYRVSDGVATSVREEAVSKPESVVVPTGAFAAAGSAFGSELTDALQPVTAAALFVVADLEPRAREVAVLGAAAFERGEGVPAELATPTYLRQQVVDRH